MTFLRLITPPYLEQDQETGSSSPKAHHRGSSVAEWLAKSQIMRMQSDKASSAEEDDNNDDDEVETISPLQLDHPQSVSSSAATTKSSPSSLNKHQPELSVQTRLKAAITTVREAETLHAYDVGVCAALQSMTEYWNQRANESHVSNAEKRIFRREAQRVMELMQNAEQEMLASNSLLAKKQKKEQRLLDEVKRVEGGGRRAR
ncbi:hypothetical protein B0T17DRAFT_619256 [Bombardia bombarda]|uniref:Uncharacterized protein n=1 Tax=Bombardia bombarda TaxID=252184 RepID=A0AA40BW14_9PEZI|nr:hypothetical protein B0T17DRAFT_619256 [Bombardia bombarda]